MKKKRVTFHPPPNAQSRGSCERCAGEIERLLAQVEQLQREKQVLLEQLAQAQGSGAQQSLALAYAEAGLPGCGSGREGARTDEPRPSGHG